MRQRLEDEQTSETSGESETSDKGETSDEGEGETSNDKATSGKCQTQMRGLSLETTRGALQEAKTR
ncbi:unnamed protein product, partial [Tilletia controversa]